MPRIGAFTAIPSALCNGKCREIQIPGLLGKVSYLNTGFFDLGENYDGNKLPCLYVY
jgi:hypothetical protein